MDSVWPAVITGACGLVSGLLVGYKDEIKSLLSRATRRVDGTWTGEARDIEVPDLLRYEHALRYTLQCQLKQSGRRVTGRVVSTSDRASHITITGRLRGEFVIADYRNDDSNTTDEGVAVLQVAGTGRELRGYFVGRRMREHGVVIGYVDLKKQ